MTTDLNRPTVVATLRTEIEAAIVANFLVSAGIPARIAGSSSRGGYSACQLEIQVAVRENDFERAQSLLAVNRATTSRHPSQIHWGTWCVLATMPALFWMIEIPVPAWPALMLFGFVSLEGFGRLMQRRREVLYADEE